MELIREITDFDVLEKPVIVKDGMYHVRRTARAIVTNTEGKIALLEVKQSHYYKLPGGGLHEGETIIAGLKRALKEKLGYTVKVTGEVGTIIEIRSQNQFFQVSYCFKANAEQDLGGPTLTELETSEGFVLIWETPEQALEIMKQEKPSDYAAKFKVFRDRTFLQHILEHKD